MSESSPSCSPPIRPRRRRVIAREITLCTTRVAARLPRRRPRRCFARSPPRRIAPTTTARTRYTTPRGTAPTLSIVASLATLAPESVSSRDVDGFTPLHLAQGADDCAETMRVLLRAAPDAWATADHRGCLPVHLAAGNGGSEEAVSALLRAAETTREEDEDGPDGGTVRPPSDGPLPSGAWTDAEGNRPLHHALGCGASVAVVRLLRAPAERRRRRRRTTRETYPRTSPRREARRRRRAPRRWTRTPRRDARKTSRDRRRGTSPRLQARRRDVRALFAMTSDEETA